MQLPWTALSETAVSVCRTDNGEAASTRRKLVEVVAGVLSSAVPNVYGAFRGSDINVPAATRNMKYATGCCKLSVIFCRSKFLSQLLSGLINGPYITLFLGCSLYGPSK